MKKTKREILIPETIQNESYWTCDRCKITSDTEDRMCPCPRGGCDAEYIGNKEIKTTIYSATGFACDCGKGAKWLYMPSNGKSNPFLCEDCVPRGCDNCNRPNSILGEDAELPTGIKGVHWKWVKENDTWITLDDGKEWPCSEYDYDDDEDNFRGLEQFE